MREMRPGWVACADGHSCRTIGDWRMDAWRRRDGKWGAAVALLLSTTRTVELWSDHAVGVASEMAAQEDAENAVIGDSLATLEALGVRWEVCGTCGGGGEQVRVGELDAPWIAARGADSRRGICDSRPCPDCTNGVRRVRVEVPRG